MKEVSHKRPRVVWFHLAHQPTPQRQKVDWSEGIEERRTSEVQDFFWCWWDSWESCRLYWPHGTAQPPHCTLQTAHSVTWTLSLYKKFKLMDHGCLCNGQKTLWCGSPSSIWLFLLLSSLLFSLQQPCCSGLFVLLQEPRAWSQVWVCCFVYSEYSSPR